MKKVAGLVALAILSSGSAIAGISHKVLKEPPSLVFAAAARVAQRGADAVVNPKAHTIAFQTGTVPEYFGVNKLEVFFSPLPTGCGAASPCTATMVEVKCTKVQLDPNGFRLCGGPGGDVGKFFGRLRKEVKKLRKEGMKATSPRTNKPALDKQ
jgi:hypothetical protein